MSSKLLQGLPVVAVENTQPASPLGVWRLNTLPYTVHIKPSAVINAVRVFVAGDCYR